MFNTARVLGLAAGYSNRDAVASDINNSDVATWLTNGLIPTFEGARVSGLVQEGGGEGGGGIEGERLCASQRQTEAHTHIPLCCTTCRRLLSGTNSCGGRHTTPHVRAPENEAKKKNKK